MDIANLIQHPELLDRDTLYELRGLLALYPYYQSARLLLLQNLFLLHDPMFNEELRQAALYITDRKVIFSLVEAAHYQMPKSQAAQSEQRGQNGRKEDRTISSLTTFWAPFRRKNAPTRRKRDASQHADAAIDYVSYLLDTESEEDAEEDEPTHG